MMEKEEEMPAGLGTEPDLGGRRYVCKKCGPFWFIEHVIGSVPTRCNSCGSFDFDVKYRVKDGEGNQKNWKTDVWEGGLLTGRSTREWD